MSSYGSSRVVSSRASSVAVDSRVRASSQALDIGSTRRPPLPPSQRWSSVLEYGPAPSGRSRTPAYPTYTDALIKSSQRLRERSMSPSFRSAPPIIEEKYSPYKCNLDYYRGKTKSVYEKEPIFKDFVRNIPLSESNMYDTNNLSRIKHRFNNMLQDKFVGDQTNKKSNRLFEPASEKLAIKHRSVPPAPSPLPFIYVYHRNSRKGI